MVYFFQLNTHQYYLVETNQELPDKELKKLNWLFDDAEIIDSIRLEGKFIGPRKEMVTPWSTNAVEITQNMGIDGIERIEEFYKVDSKDVVYDPMLQAFYSNIDQEIFTIIKEPDPIIYIENIDKFKKYKLFVVSL